MIHPSPLDRIFDFDGRFFRGCKSDSEPGNLPLGYFWNAVNMINIGDTLSCRPGYRCVVTFPKGKLLGATIFRPNLGIEQIVVCVDGAIYTAPYPFVQFRQLPNVLMSSTAKQIFWCQATQSAKRVTPNDVGSAIEVINPREVLIIQDGGITAPGWYDGSNSGHDRDTAFGIPAGSSTVWVGDRMWVANGRNVFASDISDPFSFREEIYLGGVSAFTFASEVTALVKTASLEFPQLFVFTDSVTSLIQANIRNRDSWPTTDGMQTEIFPVGTPSQRSVVSHFGRISWFSHGGFQFVDAATAGKLTARIPIRDNEMMVSKNRLSEDLSLVASAAFGQYLLTSVPSGDLYNNHTWVLNNASLETLNDESGPSWSGYWMGTRPVEWVYGVIAGQERIYHVSVDEDGENRLWEAFTNERRDNGCPIPWMVETRGYFGLSSGTNAKLPGSDCKMNWADLSLVGIEEDLDIAVFYSGGLRGAYKNILSKRLSAARGNLDWTRTITATTKLFAYKAQSRKIRTQDAAISPASTGACPVESSTTEAEDDSFQLLIAGYGPAAIRGVRVFAQQTVEKIGGDPNACINEEPVRGVRFDGEGDKDADPLVVDSALAIAAFQYFTANKSTFVDYQGVSAVGAGFAETIISQQAADRVASIVAQKTAENEILKQIPPILSQGLE